MPPSTSEALVGQTRQGGSNGDFNKGERETDRQTEGGREEGKGEEGRGKSCATHTHTRDRGGVGMATNVGSGGGLGRLRFFGLG